MARRAGMEAHQYLSHRGSYMKSVKLSCWNLFNCCLCSCQSLSCDAVATRMLLQQRFVLQESACCGYAEPCPWPMCVPHTQQFGGSAQWPRTELWEWYYQNLGKLVGYNIMESSARMDIGHGASELGSAYSLTIFSVETLLTKEALCGQKKAYSVCRQ